MTVGALFNRPAVPTRRARATRGLVGMMVCACSLKFILFGFGLVGTIPAQAMAQQPAIPTLRAEIASRENLRVGDIMPLTLTAVYPPNWTVEFPVLGDKVGEFLVGATALDPVQTTPQDQRQSLKVALTIYKTGEFEIPSFEVVFTDPEGNRITRVSDPVPIEIVSVLEGESPALKDLKPQAEIAESYLWVWIGLLAVVLAAALGYFIKRRLSSRRETTAGAVATIPLAPPHEEARRALEALLARKLITSGLVKQFYFELSEIIRRMVGRQYGIVTLERTTGEILDELAGVPHEPLSTQTLERFLTRCDLVKFAKYQPMPPEQEELLHGARSFIEAVKKSYDAQQAQRALTGP